MLLISIIVHPAIIMKIFRPFFIAIQYLYALKFSIWFPPQISIYRTKLSIPYSLMEEHLYMEGPGRFTACAYTQRFARNAPYAAVFPPGGRSPLKKGVATWWQRPLGAI